MHNHIEAVLYYVPEISETWPCDGDGDGLGGNCEVDGQSGVIHVACHAATVRQVRCKRSSSPTMDTPFWNTGVVHVDMC